MTSTFELCIYKINKFITDKTLFLNDFSEYWEDFSEYCLDNHLLM